MEICSSHFAVTYVATLSHKFTLKKNSPTGVQKKRFASAKTKTEAHSC